MIATGRLILLLAAVALPFTGCERHDFEDVNVLHKGHGSHGEHHEEEADHHGPGGDEDGKKGHHDEKPVSPAEEGPAGKAKPKGEPRNLGV